MFGAFMGRLHRWALIGAICLAGTTSGAALSDDDPGILRLVSTTGATVASFRYEDLAKGFPQRELATRTPWTLETQPTIYRGPYLKDVLAAAGLDRTAAIRVVAYNHFQAILQMSEIDEYHPILAIERACLPKDIEAGLCSADQKYKPLDLDDTGPFSIIWPFDELPQSFTVGRNFIWVWFVTVIRPEL